MAGHVTSRNLLVYTIPTVIAFLSLLWFRRRRQKLTTLPSEKSCATRCNVSESVVDTRTAQDGLKDTFVESNCKKFTETSESEKHEFSEHISSPTIESSNCTVTYDRLETKIHETSKFHDSQTESTLQVFLPVEDTEVFNTTQSESSFSSLIHENDNIQETKSEILQTVFKQVDNECCISRSSEETFIKDNAFSVHSAVLVTHKENCNEESVSLASCAALGDDDACEKYLEASENDNKFGTTETKQSDSLCKEQVSFFSRNNSSDKQSENLVYNIGSSEISRDSVETNSEIDFSIASEIVENSPVHEDISLQTIPANVEEVKEIEESNVSTSVPVYSIQSEHHVCEVTDSPPHSIFSDIHSEGSSDSGKGGSDIQFGTDASHNAASELSVYEFELPQDLCGRLIGRMGKQVKYIKDRSNANIFIKKHPFSAGLKLCAVEGTSAEIQNALDIIRKKFPPSQFPSVTLSRVNVPTSCGVPIPETLQLHLPEGVTCSVILSSLVSAGHCFLQQPTHPTYPSLNQLDQCMLACYSQMDTPQLPQPIDTGIICAATVMDGWYRAQVITVHESSEECDVKFVDYGGYSRVPNSSLRQIRSDFMTLPFQASECYLANVKPVDEETGWSLEACATFEELAQGQILQAVVAAYADDGLPYVQLYRVQGVSTMLINRELVSRGVAQWIEHQTSLPS